MPEILEIEMYRRGADPVIGRRIAAVDTPDDWYLKDADAAAVRAHLTGSTVLATRRLGKLMILDTDNGPVGLRFGMTGRLIVDDVPIIEALEYSSRRLDPDWNRFAVTFDGGGSLIINDPRRLGGVLLDPSTLRLGPDVWSVDVATVRSRLGRRTTAVKAFLLDQKRVAGLGNLLADELLWRVGVHPGRPCDELTDDEIAAMVAELGPMLDELYARGGSHVGDHVAVRENGGACPRDGGPMQHDTIGGRSTWWCATHQR